MQRKSVAVLIAVLSIGSLPANAATPQEAERLGKDLTPVGAEKAGNKDGTIPEWSGKKNEPLQGWSWGKERSKFSKYKDEKRLFSIDASNVEKYADKLTPGQAALVKQIKGYRMDVYPSHRECVIPAWSEQRTKENAVEAKLAANGYGIAHAKAGGIPFPIPKNGVEAMWNQKLRVSGIGFQFLNGGSVLSPRRGSDESVYYSYELAQYWPMGRKEAKNVEDFGGTEFYTYYKYSAPAALAGQAIESVTYLDKGAPESYYYFPGQRRVRRLPTYAYDAPLLGFENEYMVDIQNMFWSTLDRFDYKLVGKKEIYVPYNAFKMYDFNAKMSDAYHKDFINPDYGRYELHRVWVVEATVKQGQRHSAPKRTYYLDEDTWNILIAEDYDATGKIWNVRQSQQIPVWELSGVCAYNPFAQYNLQSGRYVADYSVLGQGKDVRYFVETDDQHFKEGFYTPDMLRAISER